MNKKTTIENKKIYRTGDFHRKNSEGMDLVEGIFHWNEETDGIIICNGIDENVIYNPDYPNVIIGPGVDFAKTIEYFKDYQGEKTIFFNCLSKWNKDLIQKYGENHKVNYVCIPFPVNVEKFAPTKKRNKFFIYFKHRHTDDLNILLSKLSENKMFYNKHRIFVYGNYHEEDYLDYIKEAKFGIWVGSHESQGFALEEALSCDCPLFIYDVKTLKDECYGDHLYPWLKLEGDYPATSASYFDNTCGMIVKNAEEIPEKFEKFLKKLNNYEPRKYVLNNLTAKYFYDNIQNLFR